MDHAAEQEEDCQAPPAPMTRPCGAVVVGIGTYGPPMKSVFTSGTPL